MAGPAPLTVSGGSLRVVREAGIPAGGGPAIRSPPRHSHMAPCRMLARLAPSTSSGSAMCSAGWSGSRMTSRQSRTMSFVEAITNVGVGFLLAVLAQITLFPMLDLQVSVADNLLIGMIFTAISIVRSFALRRLFEAIRLGVEKADNSQRRLPRAAASNVSYA